MSRLVICSKITIDRPAYMKLAKILETTLGFQSIISAGLIRQSIPLARVHCSRDTVSTVTTENVELHLQCT